MVIMYALLALFAVNIFLYGQYLLPVSLALTVSRHKKLILQTDFWILLAFSVVYILFDGWSAGHFQYTILFCPIAYLLGLNFKAKTTWETAETVVVCLAVGMALHGLLNFAYEVIVNGGILYGSAHYDVWSRAISAVTAQMTNYMLLAAMAVYVVMNRKQRLWPIPFFLISTVHTVIAGGRTYLLLLGVSVAVGLAIYIWKEPRNRGRHIVLSILSVAAVVAAVWCAYSFNWLGVRTIFDSSYLYDRLFSEYAIETDASFFETGRWAIKGRFITHMPESPWGGGNIRSTIGYYAHDLWLDTYDNGGILAFLLMAVYTLRMIGRTVFAMRSRQTTVGQKVLFGSLLVVVLVQWLLEPILTAAPVLFFSIVLIDGVMARCVAEERILRRAQARSARGRDRLFRLRKEAKNG